MKSRGGKTGQMCAKGELVRVGHGLYSLPDADVTTHHGLARAAKAKRIFSSILLVLELMALLEHSIPHFLYDVFGLLSRAKE